MTTDEKQLQSEVHFPVVVKRGAQGRVEWYSPAEGYGLSPPYDRGILGRGSKFRLGAELTCFRPHPLTMRFSTDPRRSVHPFRQRSYYDSSEKGKGRVDSSNKVVAVEKSTEDTATTAMANLRVEQENETGYLKALNCNALMKAVFQPMNFVSTLIKLGHDPYPLSRGKKWLFHGSLVYFQPNVLKYVKNVYDSHGLSTLYTGVVANVAFGVASDLCRASTVRYLDDHLPELGGRVDFDPSKVGTPREMSTHQLIRVKVRQAIRDTVSQCVATTVAHPFFVIMVRQIAQHIGNDVKYLPFNILQPLRLISAEEGPAGLFSGLVPALVGSVFCVWTGAVLSVVIEEGAKYMVMESEQDMTDEQTKAYFTTLRFYTKMSTTWILKSWCHPFDVVATLMAVSGSGLAVSMLPYSPLFTHWSDVYEYLSPFELHRGSKLFLRQERGSVSAGTDGKLYASKKHFI